VTALKITKEVYRATVADLHQARLAAKERFNLAQQAGDISAGSQIVEELQLRVANFKALLSTYDPRQLIICKFEIQVLDTDKVSLVLPAGTSRLSFLREAQEMIRNETARDAVNPEVLQWWQKTAAYARTAIEPITIGIMAPVAKAKSRADQIQHLKEKNLRMALPEDLAVASVAYLIATGRSLLDNCKVRATTGTFSQDFITRTLDRIDVGDYDAGTSHAAAAYLPTK